MEKWSFGSVKGALHSTDSGPSRQDTQRSKMQLAHGSWSKNGPVERSGVMTHRRGILVTRDSPAGNHRVSPET